MTPRGARLIRYGLIGLVVLVGVSVGLSSRRRKEAPASAPPPAASQESAPPPGATKFGDLVFRKYRDGKELLLLKAGAMVAQGKQGMHLRSVEATLPRVQDGKEETLTIRADECLYQPDVESASFSGNVRISTSDGVELETATLNYDGRTEVATTDDPVQFRRGTTSGSSRGVTYDGRSGRGVLAAEVELRSEREGSVPAVVTAGRGELARREAEVRFDGGVQVLQGKDHLSAGSMKLSLSQDLRSVNRMVAVDDVVLDAAGSEGLGSVSGGLSGGGARRLTTRRLDVWFADDGKLHEVTAVKDAELVGESGKGGNTERRRVASRVLFFRFDSEGRLSELEGQEHCEVSTEPSRPKGAGRRVTSNGMRLSVDPATGALVSSRFTGDVKLIEPGRRATAQVVVQDDATGLVHLSGGPKVAEDQRGSELTATEIALQAKGGALTAKGDVRHTMPPQSKKADRGAGPFSQREAVEATAGLLDYDPGTRRATYRDNAVLKSGEDTVRGDTIAVDESAVGQRKLRANGHVVCRLHSRGGGEDRRPVPIDVTSGEMEYDEVSKRIVYRTNVRIHRADIETSSPTATVVLGGDGDRIESLVAGEPVEVIQGARKASGRVATYTPVDETMVIVGDKVLLTEPSRTVEGKRVVFQVGHEQVRVEGLDETRTETVIRKQKGKMAP